MDSLFAIAKRLTAALFLCVFVLCGRVAYANDASCYATGQQTCARALQNLKDGWPYAVQDSCTFSGDGGSTWVATFKYHYGNTAPGSPGQQTPTFGCPAGENPNDGAPPSTPCKSAPHASQWRPGKILEGYQATITITDPSTGVTVPCRMHLNPLTPPMLGTDGDFYTYIGVGPDDAGAPDASPIPTGEVTDGAGNPAPGVPSDFPADGSGVTPKDPPQVCGGVSCYDPKTGTACGLVNGVQACVQGPPSPAQNGGDCATMGDGTLCNGNPPPKPNAAKVPDPPTWTKGIDQRTFVDPSTGATFNQTTIVYGPPGQVATSGQKTGDMGPAPASSSSAKPSSGYSDGGDCTQPPVCTGDAVMCGVARETWRNRCSAKQSADQAHKDLTGDGPPQDFDSLKTKYGQGDVWTDTPGQGDGGVGDAANQGNYDQSGFGYSRQCPLKDLTVNAGRAGTFVVKLADLCLVGDWVRGLIIAMALYAAFCITRGASMKGVG